MQTQKLYELVRILKSPQHDSRNKRRKCLIEMCPMFRAGALFDATSTTHRIN